MMCFFVFLFGLQIDKFVEFPNMSYLVLIEADVLYVCKVLLFLSDQNVKCLMLMPSGAVEF